MDIAYPHNDNMRRLHLHRGILILLMTMRVMSGEVAAAASPQPQCPINIVLFEPAKMTLPLASTMSDVLLRPPA
jgi:hypothetical protein